MLQAIRERAQGIVAWVIIVLISVPFAFWGIQNYFDVGQEMPVAVVGDKEFFQRDANVAYQQYAQNPTLIARFGEQELRRQSLAQLVNDEVVAQLSSDLGLRVSDHTVRDFNKSLPYFQTDGKFDKEKYKVVLASQGQSSQGFAEKIRKSLLLDQFRQGIMNSDFATPVEINSVLDLQNQEREIIYATVPLSKVDVVPDDEAIAAYHQEHQALFMNPERVSINYIELSADVLADDISVSEQELLDHYDSTKDAYSKEEKRRVSHILVSLDPKADQETVDSAREKIEQIKSRLLGGEDFAILAKTLSDDTASATKGGDLGLIAPGFMEKNFEEAAFKLGKAELSDPVKTPFGYHLIKVTELELAETEPFETVKEKVSESFRLSKAENQFYELGETLAELSFENPDSLESAADAVNLEIKQSSLFTRSVGDGIAAQPKIREMAFSEDVIGGQNSEPVELRDDKIIVLRIREHQKATMKPIDSVRNEIKLALEQEAAKEKTKSLADEVYGKVQQGIALSEITKQYESLKLETKTVSRKRTEIPLAMQKAVFKAPKPDDGDSRTLLVELATGEQAIVQILAVKKPNLEKIEEKAKQSIENVIARLSGQSLFAALVSKQRKEADVKVLKSDDTE